MDLPSNSSPKASLRFVPAAGPDCDEAVSWACYEASGASSRVVWSVRVCFIRAYLTEFYFAEAFVGLAFVDRNSSVPKKLDHKSGAPLPRIHGLRTSVLPSSGIDDDVP
jgi:hypothetical protein